MTVRLGRLAVRFDPDGQYPQGYSILSPVRLPGEGFGKSVTGKFPGVHVMEMTGWEVAVTEAAKLARKHHDRLMADAAMKEQCS